VRDDDPEFGGACHRALERSACSDS
jgi:hypothetical protein